MYNDDQNHGVQLVVEMPNNKWLEGTALQEAYDTSWRIRIDEIPVDEAKDPHKVLERIDLKGTQSKRTFAKLEYKRCEEEGDGEGMKKWEQELHTEVHELDLESSARTTLYKYRPSTEAKSYQRNNHKTCHGLVAYRQLGDPKLDLYDPDSIKTGYGWTTRRLIARNWAMPEHIRKWQEDPEKRIDPIDAGRRTLNMLQKAKLLGRFDTRTGRIIQPIWTSETLQG